MSKQVIFWSGLDGAGYVRFIVKSAENKTGAAPDHFLQQTEAEK